MTLGRALLALGRLDEAQAELNIVLASASDNLTANRALAEVYQKRGQLPEALAQYKRALELAKFDLDLEYEIRRLESLVSPPAPSPPSTISVEELFDFDTLLAQLGESTKPKPELHHPPASIVGTPGAIESVELPADEADPFSVLERLLREKELQGAPLTAAPSPEELHQRRVLADLENWLAAIIADRENPLPA